MGFNYLFITGGLGPTHDDITKKVLSQYFDSPLVLHKKYLKIQLPKNNYN